METGLDKKVIERFGTLETTTLVGAAVAVGRTPVNRHLGTFLAVYSNSQIGVPTASIVTSTWADAAARRRVTPNTRRSTRVLASTRTTPPSWLAEVTARTAGATSPCTVSRPRISQPPGVRATSVESNSMDGNRATSRRDSP